MVLKMYEDLLLISVSGAISLLIILLSTVNLNRFLKNISSSKVKPVAVYSEVGNYIAKKKELEYMKDIIQKTIVRIYKEHEEGKISEEEKDLLLSKFKDRLLEVEKELGEVSLYAELETLEREYKKLIDDFEKRKGELEGKIDEIKNKLRIKEVKTGKAEEKHEEKEKPKKEEDLSELMKKVAEMMKKIEEE